VLFNTLFHTRVVLTKPFSRWAEVESAQLCSIDENSNTVHSKVPQGPFSRSYGRQSPIPGGPLLNPRLTSLDPFSGRIDTIADTPTLDDADRNTSTHVFSNISNNSAFISHLSRNVSWQVGEYIILELRVVQEPAVGHPSAVVQTAVPHPPPPPPPPPSPPPAPRAMPIVEIRRPLACTERRTEVRGRVVGDWFCFQGARGCGDGGVRGGRRGWGSRGCTVHGVRRDRSYCALCLCVA